MIFLGERNIKKKKQKLFWKTKKESFWTKEAADEAVNLAVAAVRRWNALPMGTEEAQKSQVQWVQFELPGVQWQYFYHFYFAEIAQILAQKEKLSTWLIIFYLSFILFYLVFWLKYFPLLSSC